MVVLWNVAEGLHFDCGQDGSFVVFAIYLQLHVVVELQRTAALSVMGYY